LGDTLFIQTNLNAPNNRIVYTTIDKVSPENWKNVIPEKEMVLSASSAGGKLFASYLQDARSLVEQYDLNGNLDRKIELPGIGTASGFHGKNEDEIVYFNFSSYTVPNTVYRYEIATGDTEIFREPKVAFDPEAYE